MVTGACSPTTRTFDYVRYDEDSVTKQEAFKAKFEELEQMGIDLLPPGRARSLLSTKLEEAYMWTGKAIRDEQIARNNASHEPARTNQ